MALRPGLAEKTLDPGVAFQLGEVLTIERRHEIGMHACSFRSAVFPMVAAGAPATPQRLLMQTISDRDERARGTRLRPRSRRKARRTRHRARARPDENLRHER